MTCPTHHESRVAALIRRGQWFTIEDVGCEPRTFEPIAKAAKLQATGMPIRGLYHYCRTVVSDAWAASIRARQRQSKYTPERRMRRKLRRAQKAGLL